MAVTTERLFLAVDLDAASRAALARGLVAIADPLPGRPVPPANWHLTLRFLGDVDEQRKAALHTALDRASLGNAFAIRFSGLGAFPKPRRATVLWIGVDEGAARLETLASSVEAAVRAAGFAAEEKPFRAHLTVSRMRVPCDVAPLVQRSSSVRAGHEVRAVTLFRSALGAGPPVYQALAQWPLVP